MAKSGNVHADNSSSTHNVRTLPTIGVRRTIALEQNLSHDKIDKAALLAHLEPLAVKVSSEKQAILAFMLATCSTPPKRMTSCNSSMKTASM